MPQKQDRQCPGNLESAVEQNKQAILSSKMRSEQYKTKEYSSEEQVSHQPTSNAQTSNEQTQVAMNHEFNDSEVTSQLQKLQIEGIPIGSTSEEDDIEIEENY